MRDKRLIHASEQIYLQRYNEAKLRIRLGGDISSSIEMIKARWSALHTTKLWQTSKAELDSIIGSVLQYLPMDQGLRHLVACRAIGACSSELPPSHQLLKNALSIISDGSYGWHAFIEGFVNQETAPATKKAWIEFLCSPLTNLTDYLETSLSAPGSLDLFGEIESDIKDLSCPAFLWSIYGTEVRVSSWAVLVFSLLEELDEQAVPRALESVPSYLIRKSLFERLRVGEDPDLIISLLKTCETTFVGKEWTGVTVMFLCLTAGLRYAERVCAHQSINANELSVELPVERLQIPPDIHDYLALMCKTLASRSDSINLSIEFAAELVRKLIHKVHPVHENLSCLSVLPTTSV